MQESTADHMTNDFSPDGDERLADFLRRHGGPGAPPTESSTKTLGTSGWSRFYAADGCSLRCEWTISGDRRQMNYSEIPADEPDAPAA